MSVSAIPQDYHLHTEFSIDCQMPLANLCQQAIQVGIREICTTDHVEFVPEDKGFGYFQPEGFLAELERCRARYGGELTIRGGVEIGEVHRYPTEVAQFASDWPFDFIIGSLHWVGAERVLSHAYFEGKSEDAAYGAYFAELLALVQAGDFDVVGHFDVAKRYGFDTYGPFDPHRYAGQIREILQCCVDQGIGLEINTGSMRRPVGEPSPPIEVLRWYREVGGEILTIGSDGHRPTAVGYQLDLALELARTAGFTHLTRFRERQPAFVPIA